MSKDVEQQPKQDLMHEGPKVFRAILCVFFSVVICLGFLDIVLRFVLPQTQILDHVTDIQSAEMLHTRLGSIRKENTLNVAVLGDSLIYGRTMRDHGDENWTDHTLAAQLEKSLQGQFGSCAVNVVNLGMNGLLPADLNALSKNVVKADPDLVIFDLSLRSFSRDFEKTEAQMSRPWLRDYAYTDSGSFSIAAPFKWYAPGDVIHEALMNVWYLYTVKAQLQSAVFDGQPVQFLQRVRDRMNDWFNGEEGKAAPHTDELLLLFKARSRYDKIDLNSDNPQVMALHELLKMLVEEEQEFLSFYATENVSIRDELMEPEQFLKWQSSLVNIFAKYEAQDAWLGVMDLYQNEHYLDHVHLNADGYALLASSILPYTIKHLKEKAQQHGCQ